MPHSRLHCRHMACALHHVGATTKHPATSCSDNRKRTRLPAPRLGHAAAAPLAGSTSVCRVCACARCHLCHAHCCRVASSARHLTTSPPRQAQVTWAQHHVPFTSSWLYPMLTDATAGHWLPRFGLQRTCVIPLGHVERCQARAPCHRAIPSSLLPRAAIE
jgi:hypothetical protein